MNRIAPALLVAAALTGCATGELFQQEINQSIARAKSYAAEGKAAQARLGDQGLIEAAKRTIADSLKDPGSAQFRNVRVNSYDGGVVVCGEVNGKNSYGGYVGFSRFYASDRRGILEDRDTRYPEIARAYNTGLVHACS